MEIKIENLHFFEPRLAMDSFSRFLARLIIYSFYAVLVAATGIFLFSDVKKLFWLGVLFALFLGYRLLHIRQAERSTIGLTRYLPRLSRRNLSQEFQNLNVVYYLPPNSFAVIERAYDRAVLVGGDFYFYVLKSLVRLPNIRKALTRMDVNAEDLERKIEEFVVSEEIKNIKESKSDLLIKIELFVKMAFLQAIGCKNRFIDPHNLFAVLGNLKDQKINRLFSLFEINPADLEKAMIFSRFDWRTPRVLGGFAQRPYKIRHRVMNRAWTSRPTPTLDKYGVDFTDLARAGKAGFLVGHKEEYARLVDILSRPTKPNALLVGEPGTGKETIVSALAFGIIKDEVPEAIFDKRIVSLSIGSLISGAPAEEVADRLNKIVEEIILTGNIILYIPDIHNLIKTSEKGGLNAADILLPIINNDVFPIIGVTYPMELKTSIESHGDFSAAFEIIRVEEISEDEAMEFLTYDSLILEKKYKMIISFGAIKTAVFLAHKHFRYKSLPSSAEDLLKESLAYASQRNDKLLQADDIIAVAQRKINVPLYKAGKEEAGKLLNLENIIHERLVDQEEAVKAVSRALREYRSGLSRKGGPIAAFLFVGPTGVGKTELSKILASIQFGSEEAMVRFDMTEYQIRENILRFIGSTDGKIVGVLTEAIIQKPYSLVLLDEFEKAHPDILNLFLQVFDDGRLTDGLGRTVDFTNTIIIATSNAHSNFIKERIEAGDNIEKISEELKKKLTEYFKPELLNRFSDIVAFKNLSPKDIEAIAGFQLKSLAKTVSETHGIGLDFDATVVKRVAELGYDPVFGARPLRGVISEKLRSPLAEKILRGEIIKGGNVKVVLENGEIKFVL